MIRRSLLRFLRTLWRSREDQERAENHEALVARMRERAEKPPKILPSDMETPHRSFR